MREAKDEEGSMSELTKPVSCQVRSGTDNPCRRPASVTIRGVPFCEPCAREQEAYFTIGELTEGTRRFDERALSGNLGQVQRMSRRRSANGTYEPNAA
jgi:hypothetical protein